MNLCEDGGDNPSLPRVLMRKLLFSRTEAAAFQKVLSAGAESSTYGRAEVGRPAALLRANVPQPGD